ncbi:MAG: VanW family protein [Anaerolineaceae bacterium]
MPLETRAAQILAALLTGAIVYIVLLLAITLAYRVMYAGKIFPGVSIEGIALDGLPVSEAADKLRENITYPVDGKITFQYKDQVWTALPTEVGLYLDVETSAVQAYRYGRQENLLQRPFMQFKALISGAELPAQFIFDEQTAVRYLQNIAAQIDKPTREASLSIEGVNVLATPGQIGYALDIPATIASLYPPLQNLEDGIVPLVVKESPPDIMDVSAQAEKARQIISSSLVLQLADSPKGDAGPWTLSPEQVAQMLTIVKQDNGSATEYQVALETSALQKFLENIAPKIERQPENARFVFNDETKELELIQPAVIGRKLDIPATLAQINEKIAKGEHSIPLMLNVTNPTITDNVKAKDLGITELVSKQMTFFYGSSGDRIKNIETASARFHGVLVPPNTTFSMAEVLGDVSLDSGYAEALIIFGNQTIKGVGGGVCQVSTTLFRTAFFGGFPIVERYPHAYRVSYYEYDESGSVNENLAGLDATVYVPVVDFKFTNDTPYWLLMETYVNAAARKLTWKFYSTSDGRTVDWETSGLRNIVEPGEPILRENPDLAKNEIVQVEWEVAGADITINRTVYKNDQIYFEDSYYTHYIPWQAVYEYGPGSNLRKLLDTVVPMP